MCILAIYRDLKAHACEGEATAEQMFMIKGALMLWYGQIKNNWVGGQAAGSDMQPSKQANNISINGGSRRVAGRDLVAAV
jgi:hypothetical protein